MSQRTCSVCERKHYARGYCKAHYQRIHEGRGLDPDRPLRELPTASERDDVVARILAKSEPRADGCIEMRANLNENGYGTVHWRGKRWLAHRAMWTERIGDLPSWPLVIDHLCRNRACVNTDHMEVVTQGENAERGGGRTVGVLRRQAAARRRTACSRGHDRAEHEHTTPGGFSYCRACRAENYQASKSA